MNTATTTASCTTCGHSKARHWNDTCWLCIHAGTIYEHEFRSMVTWR